MEKWEMFEVQCTDYLNDRFGAYAKFSHQGGADSTTPDILVETYSNKSFYIEAKYSPAQCGQFVLLPNLKKRTFEYSQSNVNQINKYAELIINYMNNNFDSFREAGTAGKDINIPNSTNIFANWIVYTYKDKKVDFFITNNNTILPIDRFKEYFDITAKYRVKRSGSSNVGRNHIKLVLDYIRSNNYNTTDYHVAGDKLFIASPQQLHNQRFILLGIEYMFSKRGKEYELRKLSNTYNANVIFSIKYNSSMIGMSEIEFIDYLK